MHRVKNQTAVLLLFVFSIILLTGCSGQTESQALAEQDRETILKIDDIINCMKEDELSVKKQGAYQIDAYTIEYYVINKNILLMMSDFGTEHGDFAEEKETTGWDTEAFQQGLSMFGLEQNTSGDLYPTDLRAGNILAHFEVISKTELTEKEQQDVKKTSEHIKDIFLSGLNQATKKTLTGSSQNFDVSMQVMYYQTEVEDNGQILYDSYLSYQPKITVSDQFLSEHPNSNIDIKISTGFGPTENSFTNPIQKNIFLEQSVFQDILIDKYEQPETISLLITVDGVSEKISLNS